MKTTFDYYSGCRVTGQDPTPGTWKDHIFTSTDGSMWTTVDLTEDDPRIDGTGVHYLIPHCADLIPTPYDDQNWYEFLPAENRETGKWHGMLYRNQPTPSGCDRWLLKISDNRGWETAKEAVEELKKSLIS